MRRVKRGSVKARCGRTPSGSAASGNDALLSQRVQAADGPEPELGRVQRGLKGPVCRRDPLDRGPRPHRVAEGTGAGPRVRHACPGRESVTQDQHGPVPWWQMLQRGDKREADRVAVRGQLCGGVDGQHQAVGTGHTHASPARGTPSAAPASRTSQSSEGRRRRAEPAGRPSFPECSVFRMQPPPVSFLLRARLEARFDIGGASKRYAGVSGVVSPASPAG